MFAFLPFFELRVFDLDLPIIGTIPIDPWATLVCLGFVAGLEVSRYRGVQLGLDVRDIVDGAVVTVLTGFFIGHVFTVFAYYPERLSTDGIWAILRVWQGFSSTGGFIGAIIGSVIMFKYVRKVDYWRHADVITYGFPVGWFLGRVGCGVVHDHIGRLTKFPLAMEFPNSHFAAGIRHELGLYEAAYMLPIALLFMILGKQDRQPGFFLALFALLYAPLRFCLDFLRNYDLSYQDARYLGLTPAQYGMVLMFMAGALLMSHLRNQQFEPWPLDGSGPPTPEVAPSDEEEEEGWF
jgi:phosphatidylglycerol:prolipoprotein diacylglycerol transferase